MGWLELEPELGALCHCCFKQSGFGKFYVRCALGSPSAIGTSRMSTWQIGIFMDLSRRKGGKTFPLVPGGKIFLY